MTLKLPERASSHVGNALKEAARRMVALKCHAINMQPNVVD
jgi:hypothetical protein